MTNFNINDIISQFKIEGSFEAILSVISNACEYEKNPQCRSPITRRSTNAMEEKKIKLLEAANYLILLFYRANQKYSCTRTKIGKLLSIVAFKYARNNQKVFEESIYKYNDCGTAIKEIMNKYEREIYSCFDYQDKLVSISEASLSNEDKLSDELLNKYPTSSLDDDFKATIREVFLKFGAYSPTVLGECINCIVSKENMVEESGKIELPKINDLALSDFKGCNPVAENLLKYLFD